MEGQVKDDAWAWHSEREEVIWVSAEGSGRDVFMYLCVRKNRDTLLSLLRDTGLKGSALSNLI